jgi:hypothetical protein
MRPLRDVLFQISPVMLTIQKQPLRTNADALAVHRAMGRCVAVNLPLRFGSELRGL